MAVVTTLILQLCAIYLPWFNAVLKTRPLTPRELFACLGVSACFFILVELEKWFFSPGKALSKKWISRA